MFTLEMFVFVLAVVIFASGVVGSSPIYEESVRDHLDSGLFGEYPHMNQRKPRQNALEFLANPFSNGGNTGRDNQGFSNSNGNGFRNSRPQRQNPNNIFFDDDNQFGDFGQSAGPISRQFDVQPVRSFGSRWPNRPANGNQLEWTTRRPLGTTVAVPGMGTTRSACEDTCQTTNQYNPVCGDNNVTYFNVEKLKCAQRCGKNIRIQFNRACARF